MDLQLPNDTDHDQEHRHHGVHVVHVALNRSAHIRQLDELFLDELVAVTVPFGSFHTFAEAI